MPATDEQVQKHIGQLVRTLRARYLREEGVDSYYNINNGLCDEFAEDLKDLLDAKVPGTGAFTVEGGNFTKGFDGPWDAKLLEKHWGMSPPEGFTWAQLNRIHFGAHVWLTHNRRHYDAECPDGVDNFFDLPLFRQYIVAAGRRRGLPLPDVVTDDVKPTPTCGVPLPV